MSYSPAPTPPWPGESDSPSLSKSSHARTETDSDPVEHESVLETLREQVVAGEPDTETDPRVDAEVCRVLRIRSIATVPVRSNNATVGLLEVFSTEPRAFTDEHVAFLSSLAGLAEMACAHIDFRALPDAIPTFAQSPPDEVESAITSAFWSATPWWQQPKWRY